MHGNTRGRWTVGVLGTVVFASAFGLAAAAGRAGAVPQAGPRTLFVSVLDQDGAPVTSLAASDFVVREDGVSREVVSAARATEPVTFVVLVDTSQAARPFIPDMRRALTAFVNREGGKNPMTIVGFGERPTVFTDYTLDVPSLRQGVDRVFATSGSGSYMLQAVDEACASLAKRDFERAEILVITGGGPEFSERTYDEPIPKLRASGARLDVMSFDMVPPDMSNFGERNREQFNDAAPRAVGGTRFSLISSMALDGALTKLADELANQYRVTYSRPDRLIPPTKVEVTVRQAGLTTRATPARVKQG